MKKLLIFLGISIYLVGGIGQSLFGQATDDLQTSQFKLRIKNVFYSTDDEIAKTVIKAVIDGKILPYCNESLTIKMDAEVFMQRATSVWMQHDTDWTKFINQVNGIYQLDVFMEVTHNQKMEASQYDLKAIGLVLPKEYAQDGSEQLLGFIPVEEIAELFNSNPYALYLSEKAISKEGLLNFKQLQLSNQLQATYGHIMVRN